MSKKNSRGTTKGGKPAPSRAKVTGTVRVRPVQNKRKGKKPKPPRRVVNTGAVSGTGAYFGDMGASAGNWLGRKAGSFVDSVFGLGSYNVRRNSLLNSRTIVANPNGPPRVVNAKRGEATVVNHREYVGDLSSGVFVPGTTSTEFTITRYQLNPGNSSLFPWLSAAASAYQEYEINGMLVELVTEASEVSTNLAMGVMAMAAEYNPLAETPVTKQQMLELEYADVAKASHSLIMPIECSRVNDAETHLFIALDNNYMGTDARTFDLAAMFIATVGQPAELTKIAEIWVTYEVFLFKPRLPHFIGTPGLHAWIEDTDSGAPFGLQGADFKVQPGSNAAFSYIDEETIRLPGVLGMHWFLLFYWEGDVGTTDSYEFQFQQCEVIPNMFSSSTANHSDDNIFVETPTSANPSKLMQALVVKVTGTQPTLELSTGGVIAGSYGDFYAFPLPADLVSRVQKKRALRRDACLEKRDEDCGRFEITHHFDPTPAFKDAAHIDDDFMRWMHARYLEEHDKTTSVAGASKRSSVDVPKSTAVGPQ